MMKNVMKNRVAALALAALPLTAAPAFADEAPHRSATAFSGAFLSVADASFYISVGNDRWRGRDGRYYSNDRYGQRPWQTRQLRRDAVRQCAAVIQRQGYRAGFRDVDIDNDLRVRQIGPQGFVVRFDDVEFEGRRREFYRDVSCTVRRGQVVQVAGLPEPGRRGNRGYNNGYNNGHHGYRSHSSTTYGPRGAHTVTTTTASQTPDPHLYGGRGNRDDRGHRRGN
ncbi:MAG TPA: hypothetical protein EYG02_14200 [Henriciella marina]|nr:hypothetical protein [Henriciella sp.]HIK66160.1 hypothetical protein [Henriciella marina]